MIFVCALLLIAAVALVVGGAKVGAKHQERAHLAHHKKAQAILAESKRNDYNARAIHKDAMDALLEVRQLTEAHKVTAIEVQTLLAKAEQIMNDPRVQYALTHTHG